jgi:hypothetical protein
MSEEFIDYGQLIDDAMHVIVQKALQRVEKSGLPGSHHFFISFLTEYPGVQISEKLRKKYPEEMTIVLQYQFDDLHVTEEGFSVSLSFDNVKEPLRVPFAALSAFADPSVKFGLQFRHINLEEDLDEEELDALGELEEIDNPPVDTGQNNDAKKAGKSGVASAKKKKSSKKDGNVVNLDAFRKK